jgi:branched-chain amino acid transport system ATP-binding protein
MTTAPAPLALELSHVTAGYDRTVVLRDVSLQVPAGSIVALLGANGAGKTTLVRTAGGLLRARAGTVRVDGKDMTGVSPNRLASAGVCLIPDKRGIFPNLTVGENLRVQTPGWVRGAARTRAIDSALDAFPVLRPRLHEAAGRLSGGQQQMLALARCHLGSPRVVLLDEVSMGLAPKVVDEIFDFLRQLAATGVAMLLIEQYVNRALDIADQVVLLDRGQVARAGPASGMERAALLRGYLGVDPGDVAPPPGE